MGTPLNRHKPHDAPSNLNRRLYIPSVVVTVLMFLLTATNTSQAQDARELVRLPEPMQEHMLGNMRDHLATLNEKSSVMWRTGSLMMPPSLLNSG